jgi:hypothetical protein
MALTVTDPTIRDINEYRRQSAKAARFTGSNVAHNLNEVAEPEGYAMATEGEVRAAEIAAAEARTDTKIVRIEGKIDLVIESVRASREEARDNRRAVIANGWVIFGALVVIVGILYTAAPVILDFGFKWREAITKEVQEQVRPQVPVPPSTQQ